MPKAPSINLPGEYSVNRTQPPLKSIINLGHFSLSARMTISSLALICASNASSSWRFCWLSATSGTSSGAAAAEELKDLYSHLINNASNRFSLLDAQKNFPNGIILTMEDLLITKGRYRFLYEDKTD
jgi:hypothetical protein